MDSIIDLIDGVWTKYGPRHLVRKCVSHGVAPHVFRRIVQKMTAHVAAYSYVICRPVSAEMSEIIREYHSLPEHVLEDAILHKTDNILENLIWNDDMDGLNVYVAQGKHINYSFLYACHYNCIRAVDILLEHGAWNLIDGFIVTSSSEIRQRFLSMDESILLDPIIQEQLPNVVNCGDFDLAIRMLQHMNAITDAIMYATLAKAMDASSCTAQFRFLCHILKRCDVDACNYALVCAARMGNIHACEIAVDFEADALDDAVVNTTTPDIVKCMLERGSDPHIAFMHSCSVDIGLCRYIVRQHDVDVDIGVAILVAETANKSDIAEWLSSHFENK